MGDEPEVIRQQMEETRAQLTEKLEILETQVTDVVQSASSAVSDTVDAVQGTMTSVRGAFDFRRHVDEHPFIVVGGAALVGFVAAQMWSSSARRPVTAELGAFDYNPQAMPAPQSPGLTASLFGAMSGLVQSAVMQTLPHLLGLAMEGMRGLAEPARQPSSSPPEEDFRETPFADAYSEPPVLRPRFTDEDPLFAEPRPAVGDH